MSDIPDLWLPLDDPAGSRRWIRQQDVETLREELGKVSFHKQQANRWLDDPQTPEADRPPILEDWHHCMRLMRDLDAEIQRREENAGDWSPEWPTEEGTYWFWGGHIDDDADRILRIIQVVRGAQSGILYYHSYPVGHTIHPQDYTGHWQRIPTPVLPKEEE